MPEEVVLVILGICTLGAAMVLVPFLLHHQRKMAEILHQKNTQSDDLSRRLDTLTDAVYQLASRVDHAIGKDGSARSADEIARRLEVPPRIG